MTTAETHGLGCAGGWDVLIDRDPSLWPEHLADSRLPAEWRWERQARLGGYPEPATLLGSGEDRAAWFEGYLRTYLERDLQRLSSIADLVSFQRLVRASALRLGQVINQAEIARDIGLPSTSVQRYLGSLETSYQIVRLPPFAVNRTKRLVKSPKLQSTDTGLALALADSVEPGGAHLENLLNLLAPIGSSAGVGWRNAADRKEVGVEFAALRSHPSSPSGSSGSIPGANGVRRSRSVSW